MVKLNSPLFSFSARRRLGDDVVFQRRGHLNIASVPQAHPDAKSPGQLSWRTMFQKVVSLWHALSPSEKEAWESSARQKHMTGYAWFLSQALRPNPGIYLPLLGGIMQGGIDMASFKVENLPDPTANQEPVTRKYFDDNMPSGGGNITIGNYVGNNTEDLAIPHGLGSTPKAVFFTRVSLPPYVWAMIKPGQLYIISIATYGDNVAVWDVTNFYVGNASNYSFTANAAGTAYYWVALG